MAMRSERSIGTLLVRLETDGERPAVYREFDVNGAPSRIGCWQGEMHPSREEEFERLVSGHRSLMMRAIWRVVRDADLAEDVFQDALATIWRKLSQVSGHPNPRALLLRICLNQACDAVRARQRRRLVPLDEVDVKCEETPAEILERRNIANQVLAAIGRLGRRQSAAVLLHLVYEEPYEMVAQALNCSEATARVHVLRAREKLRGWLSHLRSAARGGVAR
jgi:RNA polymerase sigma-70 factor, ECF subfamily